MDPRGVGYTMTGFDAAMGHIQYYDATMVKPTLEDAARAGAEVAKKWVEENMRQGKSGVNYPHLKTKPSSAPGQTPAVQEYRGMSLIDSLRIYNKDSGKPRVGRAIFGAGYGLIDGHAAWMEFGTGDRVTRSGRPTGRVEKRPYMRPAIDNNKKDIGDAMRASVQEKLKVVFK